MIDPQQISLVLYNLSLLPIVFLSVLFMILSLFSLFFSRPHKHPAKLNSYPFVTVQVPSYNDPVAKRCIKACLGFDYPKDRYEIMILDDSTDSKARALLSDLAKKHGLKYIHRENRNGYKPGALESAMPHVKGEIIAIFDSDFVPKPSFLKEIVKPFEDPKVAIVQASQGFLNHKTNFVTRFAAYLLMMHHTITMPINNKLNTVFFCGTTGALRKKAIVEAGGWNALSITEDTDLSIRMLAKGYKSVYIEHETPSEVPITLESFLKQQMRWTFGNTRAFIDHKYLILSKSKLKWSQRIMISFLTLTNILAPFVIIMTFAGMMGWFLGDPKLFELSQLQDFLIKFLYTIGFIVMGFITFHKQKRLREFPHLVLGLFTLSIVLAFANSVAVFRALFMPSKLLYSKDKSSWICTPKVGNEKFVR